LTAETIDFYFTNGNATILVTKNIIQELANFDYPDKTGIAKIVINHSDGTTNTFVPE